MHQAGPSLVKTSKITGRAFLVLRVWWWLAGRSLCFTEFNILMIRVSLLLFYL
jgi:hypothetical protein